MEIGKIVFNKKEIRNFVDEYFIQVYLDKIEKLENNHPLFSFNFNRSLRNATVNFTFFGSRIEDIYALENSNGYYCIFMIMEISTNEFGKFVEHLGYPENLPKDEYLKGDFTFLHWNNNGFDLFINRHHHGGNQKGKYLIKVFNTPYEETVDLRKMY